jgi:hypothetical protein
LQIVFAASLQGKPSSPRNGFAVVARGARLEGWLRFPWFETALKKRLLTMRFPVSVTPSKPA